MASENPQLVQPTEWRGPRLTLRWGDYFKPNATDAKELFDAINVGMNNCKIITKRKAIEMAQRVAKIDNVDSYLDTLEQEAADAKAKSDKALEDANQHEIDLMKAAGHGNQSGQRPGAGTNPQAQAGSGDGAAPIAEPKGKAGPFGRPGA